MGLQSTELPLLPNRWYAIRLNALLIFYNYTISALSVFLVQSMILITLFNNCINRTGKKLVPTIINQIVLSSV